MRSYGRLPFAFMALSLAFNPLSTLAATGVAYESVTKFSVGNSDGTVPAPGTFQADFQAAADAATSAGTNVPKMPFGLGKMMAKAQGAIAALKSGTAEKHYIGITKERVDNVATQTGDITDCTARTITHLDLAKKTYSIESLDHPEATAPPASSRATAAPGPAPTDDGTKIAIAITTKALGPKTIEGVPTTGYDMNMKMTVSKPTGESSTTNMLMTAYYSALPDPTFSCHSKTFYPAGAPQSARAPSMAMYGMMMKALTTPKGDSRFTITNSGPSVPFGKLSMWSNTQMGAAAGTTASANGTPSGINIISERGDLKAPLADTDPIFGVPAGFTKVGS